MIISLSDPKKVFLWFSLHSILGYMTTISPFFLIFFFYILIIFSLMQLNKYLENISVLTYLIGYLTAFELLARMAKTSPYIPYELSKYLMFILLMIGISRQKKLSSLSILLILLLIPALFYDYSEKVTFKNVIFNFLGPLNICLAISYFSNEFLSSDQLKTLLRLIMLPLISALVFTVVKTPDFSEINFELGAMFETSGGFGSNQVSSAFGLALLIGSYLWLTNSTFTGRRLLDLIVLFLFVFQGLLTFSRGGMIGGILGVILLVFYLFKSERNTFEYIQLKKSRKYILPTIVTLCISFVIANNITDNKLLLRYKGETAGTLAGSKEKDLNTLTTNRWEIFLGDLELFENYIFTGTGVGASAYLRPKLRNVAPHTEFSRLFAEHGVLGVLFALILFVILFFKQLNRHDKVLVKSILVALFFLGIYTSFHNATRTFMTPLLIGLSMVRIQNKTELFTQTHTINRNYLHINR